MKKDIKIPDIAENVEKGTISNVLVTEGDEVDLEQPLVEVETDKATTDIPSPFKGKILEIKVSQGEEVKVNQIIMIIEVNDGEQKDENEIKEKVKENVEVKPEKKEGKAGDEEAITHEEKREQVKDDISEEKEDAGYKQETKKKEEPERKKEVYHGSDIPASPSARKYAREAGVELSGVKGSGPGERITIDDIKKLASDLQKPEKDLTYEEPDLPDFAQWGETERKSMSNVRKLTAETTSLSWSTIPHVTQFDKADITRLDEFRKEHSKTVEKNGGKLTMTAILVKISAMALEKFPVFNTSIDVKNKEIVFKKYIHIGIAVDTERGLLIPVIRDAGKKSLIQLAVEIGQIAEKARNKKITPEEMQGGNFTVSNLGGIGGTYFTPIIYTSQVAILGISKSAMEPVWNGKKFKPALILPLSLSYDHRVIDGADGARFLSWIKNVIENPFSLLL